MIALHAGVMFCTEITDALWQRYLLSNPENLIDEESRLISTARTQSIRRKKQQQNGGGNKLNRLLRGGGQRSLISANRPIYRTPNLSYREIPTVTTPIVVTSPAALIVDPTTPKLLNRRNLLEPCNIIEYDDGNQQVQQ